MTLAQLAAVAVIVGTFIGALTLGRSMIRAGKAEAEKQAADRQKRFDDGRASRDDEVKTLTREHAAEVAHLRSESTAAAALLRSQRDDARRERDENGRRADLFEERYNNLRDRGNG